MTASKPLTLWVETGLLTPSEAARHAPGEWLDYGVYAAVPRWYRRLEEIARLDLYFAYVAAKAARRFDVVWAASEKVGIPLAFMGLRQPLVVATHHMESPRKAQLARWTGVTGRWAGIGYVSNEARDFLVHEFHVPERKLFLCQSAQWLDRVAPASAPGSGPILSIGVAKRDYPTLMRALSDLPECRAELFMSSKYGDRLLAGKLPSPPRSVTLVDYVSDAELVRHYLNCRFVVVPLESTTQNSAGITAAMEAAACGKAVIATATGGMPTYVRDGETGILVPPDDIPAMREALWRLWADPALALRMGQAGRKHMEAHFEPKAVWANISRLLAAVAAQSVRHTV